MDYKRMIIVEKNICNLIFLSAVLFACSNNQMQQQKSQSNVENINTIEPRDSTFALTAIDNILQGNNMIVCDSGEIKEDGFYFADIKKYIGIDFFFSLNRSFYWKVCDEFYNDKFCYVYFNEYDGLNNAMNFKNKIDSIYQLPISKINSGLFDAIHKDKRCFYLVNNFLVYFPEESKDIVCLRVKKAFEEIKKINIVFYHNR